MAFDVTGLLIFLLAIVPGLLAQQSRHLIVPRSLEQKGTLEQTGEYVIDSALVHLFFLTLFRIALPLLDPAALLSMRQAVLDHTLPPWGWNHIYLLTAYFVLTLFGGFLLGFLRGVLALNQPVRKILGGFGWFSRLLKQLDIPSFLQAEPVWYGVLRQSAKNEQTFVQVRMKNGAGYYTGELKSYGIVDDFKRDKDFYLVNVFFKGTEQEAYRKLNVDGILLNFADAYSIEITKTISDS
jgi:hypothetical protein